ncbi:hypothetical protein FDECE_3479 [Fusarium decemcellulare]|nr:hypothetical protein FDECE_3479 [Fusarium decemcellulare]
MAYSPRTSTLTGRSFAALFHAFGISSFVYSFYLLTTWESIYSPSFGWYFQLLTVIGLAASLVSFSFGILADVTLNHAFFDAKNATAILATPLEVVISVLYWTVRSYDPTLLMPEDMVIDFWPDVGFHLTPAVLLLLDFILLSPQLKITARGMMSLSTVSALAYWCWIELCFSRNGWYPYPMFDQYSTVQRLSFFIVSAGLLTASSSGLQWVHSKVQSPQLHVPTKLRVS